MEKKKCDSWKLIYSSPWIKRLLSFSTKKYLFYIDFELLKFLSYEYPHRFVWFNIRNFSSPRDKHIETWLRLFNLLFVVKYRICRYDPSVSTSG